MSHDSPPPPLGPLLESLAFPQAARPATAPPSTFSTGAWALPARPPRRAEAEVALLTICTVSHLPYARVLGASLERFHPEIDFYVIVTDWEETETPNLGSARLVPVEEIGIDRLSFCRLKFSAAHFCYMAKPAASTWVARHGYRKVLYFDSDIEIHAPLSALLAALDHHRFVVTPHVVAPFPRPDRHHEHPSMGDLAAAGIFNAGLYGFTPDVASLAFMEGWLQMVLAPGSFLFLQAEQNAFNWLSAFGESIYVLRDTAYNVAYWNLHDRSVRWCGFDGGGEDSWQVDGSPLVAFHFSGLPFDRPAWLSVHDRRYSLYILPSVARLVERYVAKLAENGLLAARARPYRYDSFPCGVPIDERMRRVLRHYENHLWRDVDPFTPEGEQHYGRALLEPAGGTYLVPALLWLVYDDRKDLQLQYAEARVKPERLIHWFCACGAAEHGYGRLVDFFRPTFAKREAAVHLKELRSSLLWAFADLERPLSADRPVFLRRLEQAGLASEAGGVRDVVHSEYWAVSQLHLVRQVVETREDLRRNMPDFLDLHSDHLADWLEGDGVVYHGLPPGCGELFRKKARGRAVARIYSYYRRYFRLMQAFPFAFLGQDSEGLITAMLDRWPDDCEFDHDDVVMFLWTMEVSPWIGVAATLEAPVHAGRWPSPLLPEGQHALLAPFLGRAPGFRQELDRYQETRHSAELFVEMRRAVHCLGQPGLLEGLPHPVLSGEHGRWRRGVNIFGFFKSPIGLGSLSSGLELALRHSSWEVAKSVQGNMAMVPDLELADLLGTYRYEYDTNIFVSYPHLHTNLLEAEPQAVRSGRRNIVYLAWEQRDFHHWWKEIYEDFDQLWALSSFAAEAIGRACGREVLALPAVVDFGSFPPAAAKEEVGLDPRRTTFLYVFDANSSIERKNPAAAIEAFRRAFSADEPVELLIKASHAGGLQHRYEMQRLRHLASSSGLDIRFVTDHFPRRHLLQLISAVDCYVSLHRAEGFGYTCAEAMAYGVPVIASNYSGNLDFMDEESSHLVRCREVEVKNPDGPFQRGSIWAEPEVDHAAELMRQVYEDREAARLLGARGSVYVREKLALERIAGMVAKALG